MELALGKLRGRRFQDVRRFLSQNGLTPPEVPPAFTVTLLEDETPLATGSLDGNVLQYIAVAPGRQGDGLCATVVSQLTRQALEQGRDHLMLCTKPGNRALFGGMGFYPVAETADMLLMENRRSGVEDFAAALPRPPRTGGPVGAVVANCNPFTRGHRYLAERAAERCGFLYFFLLSEDRSFFSAEDRLELARRNLANLPNIAVCPTGDYLISAATFPTYFLKDQENAAFHSAELDLKLFAERFAAPLGITLRFVGEEPLCPVTRAYNRQMLDLLPGWGVQPVVLPRLEEGGGPISASRVRELFRQGELEALRPLVPGETYRYLVEAYRYGAARHPGN